MTRAPQRQDGVMLIEALIGILIFSVGILAMIAMQAAAIKNTTDARYRSEAAFLTNQIIGEMWVDLGNLAEYADDKCATYKKPDDSMPCLAWRRQVEALLPGVNLGAGTLTPSIVVDTVNAASMNEVTVTVRWQQPAETTTRQVQMVNRINPSIDPAPPPP